MNTSLTQGRTGHLTRRHWLQLAAAASGASLLNLPFSQHAAAQTSSLRILCTAPAGSIPDVLARRVTEHLGSSYAQGAIVENRPGAGGIVAINALKTAPADGSTLLLAQGAVATVYPYLYSKLAYDPAVDLQPVSLAGETSLALAVGPAVPSSVNSVHELIVWMRNHPKLANAGSPGVGTLPHLLQAMLFTQADVPWQHVVYPGGPQAIVDLLSGHISVLCLSAGIFRQHKAAGKLRVLASSGAQRAAYFPDVPTFAEEGFKDLIVREWFGFFMPARVSSEVIANTSKTMQQALAKPELAAALTESGLVAVSSSPTALATSISAEQRYWQSILRNMNIKVEA